MVKELTSKALLTPWNSHRTVSKLTMLHTKALHLLAFKEARHHHSILMVHLSNHLTVINIRPEEVMATRAISLWKLTYV